MPRDPLKRLSEAIVGCRACPRLVAFREEVARRKRRAYCEASYWGRPVPGFGDRNAKIILVGLAPGAHGANRTGRVFTGDRSGDFLFAALHRAGLANQPTSIHADDGLALRGIYILLSARCVPPGNLPSREELARCAPFFDAELDLLEESRLVVALGAVAFETYLGYLARRGHDLPRPRPRFEHGAELRATPPLPGLIASYHVSQQNTQTGRLTPAMFDAVLHRARKLAGA
jgi:uracil-DNA glycosylase family 4